MKKPVLPEIIQSALEKSMGLGSQSGKWKLVSERLNISSGVLRNKMAAYHEEKRHFLTLAEAMAIVEVTQDFSLIHAIAANFKGDFLQHPGLGNISNEEIFNRYTNMMKELGQFSTDIHLSLIDGVISETEIDGLRKDFLRLTSSISEMMDRLQIKAIEDAKKFKYPKINVGNTVNM